MKALVSGCSQRSTSTGMAVSSTHRSSAAPRVFSSRRASPPRCRATGTAALLGLEAACRDDHDVFERRVLVSLARARADARNLVDDLHAIGYPAEHRVAVVARTVVEKAVVLQVDEELRGGAVDIAGARHGERAARVPQPVLRFVADRRPRLLVG